MKRKNKIMCVWVWGICKNLKGMNKLFFTSAISVLFAFCTASKPNRTNDSNKGDSNSNDITIYSRPTPATSTDTFIITGSDYIPIEGRSETGTRRELEGTWELDSLNGYLVPGKSALNIQPVPVIPPGTEIRYDSVTNTKKEKGITHTTTTVLVRRGSTPINQITPPQGTNYHIPAKPTISFFGANETFTGFTGCNKFSGRYHLTGRNTINLQGAAASTKMVCIGDYDEESFIGALKQVSILQTYNGRLRLSDGKKVLLVFVRKK